MRRTSRLWNVPWADAEFLLQSTHIVVGEFEDLGESQAASVNDGSVVQGVQKHESVPECKGRDGSKIGLHSGTEGYGLFLAYKLCKLLFKFKVDVQGSVKETGS